MRAVSLQPIFRVRHRRVPSTQSQPLNFKTSTLQRQNFAPYESVANFWVMIYEISNLQASPISVHLTWKFTRPIRLARGYNCLDHSEASTFCLPIIHWKINATPSVL